MGNKIVMGRGLGKCIGILRRQGGRICQDAGWRGRQGREWQDEIETEAGIGKRTMLCVCARALVRRAQERC